MFTKKAMLMTSQAVFDAMEECKDSFISDVKSQLATFSNTNSEEIALFKLQTIESFKRR